MTLAVHLLGPPSVDRDGRPAAAPRGTKTWALLAYLLLSRTPVPRSRAATLLFGDADDPVGALRWTLSQLRRLLGDDVEVTGDPLRLSLPPGAVVDVTVLARGSWAEARLLPGFGAELLEGVTVQAGAAFELWLATERRRLAAQTVAMLREAALSRLAWGDADEAAGLAARAVALEPLDESGHVLLVRCLHAAGRADAARQQVAAAHALLRDELGVAPGPALAAAGRGPVEGGTATMGRAVVEAQLEAGLAAAAAGLHDAAVDALRRAVVGARASSDEHLLARCLVALGGSLVHGVRGSDEEGLPLLHEADVVAQRCGAGSIAATARRELGYVDMLRASYDRAERWLSEAAAVADDHTERAWIDALTAMVRTDVAAYDAATGPAGQACEHARRSGNPLIGVFATAARGRLELLSGDLDAAAASCTQAYDMAVRHQRLSYMPWTEILLGEIDLRRGEVDRAATRLDHAYALGVQQGDPCWQSGALRGQGLVAAARDHRDRALDLLVRAPATCRQLPDTYAWVEGFSREALCDRAVAWGLDSAARWVDELDAFASRRGMRELVARAARHRAALGQPGAAEAAAAFDADTHAAVGQNA